MICFFLRFFYCVWLRDSQDDSSDFQACAVALYIPCVNVMPLHKGDSTCGQRAIYHGLGLTGIPIINVNNNCATGSTALFMSRQLIEGGELFCSAAE